ncbi:hypothetical protein BU25DRAFT_420570 [Macroventuria anomochaeta]|uniref:Uncharacterized protein n=1 Tax=Macroventuria anomochaeta TaxID=301207 RepID=A0ACB6S5B8_9PLEO|nr:uncharacterized protein BU25DRAFT_420570 [Macroventuria anomochaeta]KAF2629177.1 hypothetical protein BU25DRAFT_420570 [Macroventuria anomochaeta]
MEDVAKAHGISTHTGERWRKEFAHFGNCRRVRKKKAKEKGTKLGRKWTTALEKMKQLVDKEDHDREAPLPVQAAQVGGIHLAPRSLQYNLSKRLDAHLYVAATTESISTKNKDEQVQYGFFHQHHTIMNYWQWTHFTNEAHFNPTEQFQQKRILRRFKKRTHPANL